jgi:ABC-type phosphate/phosphonate transport system substrate-binding protein
MPRSSMEHTRLFLERRCLARGKAPQDFFASVATPATAEDALDDVVDGAVQAAVVDGVALTCYQRRKPGRFARLKEVQRSETFPAAVVAYRAGGLDGETLGRFREGMLRANEDARGRQLLTLWKITGFEEVPEDYERTLAGIIKAYPRRPPEPGAAPAGTPAKG